MDKEPYMGKDPATLVIVTPSIPRNLKTTGKGKIVINEDTGAQKDDMAPTWLSGDASSHEGLPQPPGHLWNVTSRKRELNGNDETGFLSSEARC